MAISHIGDDYESWGGTNAGRTLSLPPSIVEGDMIVIWVLLVANISIGVPAGYTIIANDSSAPSYQLAYKVASSSESDPRFTWPSQSVVGRASIAVFRGDAELVVDVYNDGTFVGHSSSTVICAALNLSREGCLLTHVGEASGFVYTPPGGYTKLSGDNGFGVAYDFDVPAGDTGTINWNRSPSNVASIAYAQVVLLEDVAANVGWGRIPIGG